MPTFFGDWIGDKPPVQRYAYGPGDADVFTAAVIESAVLPKQSIPVDVMEVFNTTVLGNTVPEVLPVQVLSDLSVIVRL
jgi:hypothetical protein